MNRKQAYTQLNRALHDLYEAILRAFGRQGLNGFLPDALKFMSRGTAVSGDDLLRLTVQALREKGLPPILGEPYALHMTPTLLGRLIIGNGWIPEQVPALPASAGSTADDVHDAMERAIEARAAISRDDRALSGDAGLERG